MATVAIGLDHATISRLAFAGQQPGLEQLQVWWIIEQFWRNDIVDVHVPVDPHHDNLRSHTKGRRAWTWALLAVFYLALAASLAAALAAAAAMAASRASSDGCGA